MTEFKIWLSVSMLALAGVLTASAFNANDADTLFNAYNTAYFVTNGGNAYYKTDNGTGTNPGWWTFAEEIEMAEDAYASAPSPTRLNMVTALCNGFASKNGTFWTGNKYNDDISWGVIAFSRAYQTTGNPTFRNIARNNFDAMYSRAWDTNFTGGGLWWNTDKGSKNACISGPAAVAACYLYSIYGDVAYLSKAQACYAWERRVLFQTSSGAIYDSIATNNTYNTWASTYNQGTFIGAGNFLYQATGLPGYYQDAVLAAQYTKNNLATAGIFPVYNSGDLGGFNGIFARWVARMAKDQNLWPTYAPWLNANGNAAWNFRNTNNLSWYNWTAPTPAGTNVLDSWDCSDSVIILAVALTNPPDALQINPGIGFTSVAQVSTVPNPASINLVLTNTGGSTLNWSLANTSSWLSVSASSGTLLASSPATSVVISLTSPAVTNLQAGHYYSSIQITNQSNGVVQSRQFTLVISSGNVPLLATGYNAALLAPNSATSGNPNATAFDVPNGYCFYQAGLSGSTRGLPPDGTFTSQLDGTTVFQFASSYGSTNALVMGGTYPGSGTLTLTTPQSYGTITILACSTGGGGTGTYVLNFTNGTHSQTFSFNAQDWFSTTANAAIQGFGRLKLSGSFGAEDNGTSNPNLYQTTLNLAALGLNQPVASITFGKPAASQATCILALSGVTAYREPAITQQPGPTNFFRFVGASNTWSVVANAGLPVFYYWYLNGTAIPAATNTTYKIVNEQTNHSGNYTVVVSNSFGVTTSSIVSLAVVSAPTYPYGQLVLTDRAIGYWRLDEISGNVAHDYVTTNNGTYTPKVLLGQTGDKLLDPHLAARFGSLAASNSCVTNITADFGTGGNAAFSVEAWVNGGSQTTDAGLVTKGFGNGGEQFNLDCGGGGHAFRFFVRDAAGSAHVAAGSVVPNNQWHHLVGVCNEAGGYVCLFVDGINVAQSAITPNSGILGSTLPMSIGARQSGSATTYDNQFTGYMEEVAIYGSALSTNQVQAHYQAVTNRPPTFFTNPVLMASANAGQPYSATLAANASDPNGDTTTFAKLSGPTWLSVAGNGTLSGTPLSVDVGTNGFAVRVADPAGLFSTSTINLIVIAAPPIVTSAALQGNNLLLNWVGGISPYQIQFTTNLLDAGWQNLGAPMSGTSFLVSPTNEAAFYRIYGQ